MIRELHKHEIIKKLQRCIDVMQKVYIISHDAMNEEPQTCANNMKRIKNLMDEDVK